MPPPRRSTVGSGMAPVGVRKAYYVDEDALIMWAHEIDSDEYAQRLDAIAAELGE